LSDNNPAGRPAGMPKINWDDNADFYNAMAMMELEYTVPQLDCLDIQPTDTVLDIGCGPGRISTLAAKRAKSVTSLDAAPKMLAHVKANAERIGITNIRTYLSDWFDVKPGDLEKHDIVIASRTEAMRDIEGVTALAKKYAAMVIWANAPSIPELMNILYAGIFEGGMAPPGADATPAERRANGYNTLFNRVYNLGYNPSVKVMTDGFTRVFADENKAFEFFRDLKQVPDDKADILRKNLSAYLTPEPGGGVRFRIETRSCVVWWRPEREAVIEPNNVGSAAPDIVGQAHSRFYGEKK